MPSSRVKREPDAGDSSVMNDTESVASSHSNTTTRASKRARQSMSNNKSMVLNSSNELDDTTTAANTTIETSTTRTSKRTRRNSTHLNSSAELDTTTVNSKATAMNTSIKSEQVDSGLLGLYLEDLFDMICSFRDENQRLLATIFYILPSPKDYADYYEVIKSPIDLQQIGKKILTSQYATVKQIEADLNLMLENAKKYNDPKSVLYKDAAKLKKYITEKCKDIGAAIKANKPFQTWDGTRTRDAKLKSMRLITDQTREKIYALINKQLAVDAESPVKEKVEEVAAAVNNEEEEDDDEEDESGEEDDDDEEEEEEEDEKPLKKSKKKNNESVNESPTAKLSRRTKNNPLLMAMWALYDHVKEYSIKGVQIIEPFIKLPSKRLYADYYQEIKRPIAMNTIKLKLTKRTYPTLQSLVDDLHLLFSNAMEYNVEGSMIYENAKHLRDVVLKQKSGELMPGVGSLSIDTSATPMRAGKSAAKSTGAAATGRSRMVEHNIKRLFTQLMEYCGGEDDGKNSKEKVRSAAKKIMLSQHFMSLPSRDELPDYYDKIKDPLDFATVKQRVESSHYASESDMVADCNKVLQNAIKYYNNESSQLHKDAVKLQGYLNSKYQVFLSRQSLNLAEDDISAAGATHTVTATTSNSSTLTLPKFNDLKDKLMYLYKFVEDYKLDGRELSPPFKHLPARTEYPDYYQFIKKPIDMAKILHRIGKLDASGAPGYSTLDELCQDFGQMFENACIYNEPASTLYKDALTLQRALFERRDQILAQEAGGDLDRLPVGYVQSQVSEIIESLFESTMQYQDAEGRVLSEAFIELYNLVYSDIVDNKQGQMDPQRPLLTFDLIRKRIKEKFYKRLDIFQEEVFELFNQIRLNSYFDLNPNSAAQNLNKYKYKIHRFSQLYRDAYELQRHFIQRRDELCKNGELLMSAALSYKLSSLDSHISSLIGSSTQSFDESEALLVEQRYKPLEDKLSSMSAAQKPNPLGVKLVEGDFYYMSRDLVLPLLNTTTNNSSSNSSTTVNEFIICVLKLSESGFVGHVYLRPEDDQWVDVDAKKFRKFCANEVLKSDLFFLADFNQMGGEAKIRPCYVMSMKDLINHEANFQQTKQGDGGERVTIAKSDIYACEFLYSTCFHYFRKLVVKKWSPLAFLNNGQANSTTAYNFVLTKRAVPLCVSRVYLNESLVNQVAKTIEEKVSKEDPMKVREFYRDVQYDSPPAAALQASKEKDADELDANAIDEDPELMKTAKYYEQLVYPRNNEIYRLGDFIYVKNQAHVGSAEQLKLPHIVRIDRLWSVTTQSPEQPGVQIKHYYFRGPLFLRPTEVAHEPTRLFYKNEVLKEITRQISGSLETCVPGETGSGSTKCVVLNHKSFVSSRLTEIDERDVYMCDTKYSSQTKQFRKSTKGLKKCELSAKCNEDETFFLRKELQLRKQLSPLLVNMFINYDETNNMDMDDDWDDDDDDDDEDENSSHSFRNNNNDDSNASFNVGGQHTPKYHPCSQRTLINPLTGKARIKRDKKSGYNIFSREFRRKLRENNTSLPFNAMGKEVGKRWSALSEQQKAAYEEQARLETIETERRSQEMKIQEQHQQMQQQQQLKHHQQQQQQQYAPLPQHPNHINNLLASGSNHQIHVQSQMATATTPIQAQAIPHGHTVYLTTNQNGQVIQHQIAGGGGGNGHQMATPIMATAAGGAQSSKPLILYQNGSQISTQAVQQGGYITIQQNGTYQNAQIIQAATSAQHQQQQGQMVSHHVPAQIVYDQQQAKMVTPAVVATAAAAPPPVNETPKQVLHKEAYVKYIANIKRQQNFFTSGAYMNQTSYINHVHSADWRRALDIDPSRVKVSNTSESTSLPQAWIDTTTTTTTRDELIQQLTKLRYYLVNDAVNIDRHPVLEGDLDDIEMPSSEKQQLESRGGIVI